MCVIWWCSCPAWTMFALWAPCFHCRRQRSAHWWGWVLLWSLHVQCVNKLASLWILPVRHLLIAGRTRQNTRILPFSSCSLSWSFLRSFSFSSSDFCNSRMYRPLDSTWSDNAADVSSASANAEIKFYHTVNTCILLQNGVPVTFFFSRLLLVAVSNSANDPSTCRLCAVSVVFSRSSSSMVLFAFLYSNSMVLSSDSNPAYCFLRLSLE